jgi:GMP synthase (glutamine-hydrolysing)
MKPFLFLAARPEPEAVGPEYESMRLAMGLEPDRLEHLRLDREPLGEPPLDRVAGIVVGGSSYNVITPEREKSGTQRRVEADLARLAEAALARDVPVLYTCYGIGVLTRVLGGTLGTRYAEPASAIEMTLTPEGHADPLVGVLPGRFHAFAGHKEAADELPPGAVLLASSAGCPVQVYRVGRHVYATQFHPEVSAEDFMARAVVYRHHGYFPADELDAFNAQVSAAAVTEPQRMLRRFVELADAGGEPDA